MQNFQALWQSKNYRIAMSIALLSVLWMTSGLVVSRDASDPDNATVKAAQTLTKVQVERLTPMPYGLKVRVRARTQANRTVDLKAEIIGRVTKLPLEKGQAVKAGELICQLAVEDRELRLDEATAAVTQAQLEYDGALRLKSGGFQSKTAIAGSKAKLQTAKANLQRAELNVANLNIRAPFDGIVDTRPVELGDYMRKGDICARVIDLNPLVLAGQVSEADVARLAVGGRAEARLRTGQQLQGQIRYIGHASDSVTRTFPIEVIVDNADTNYFAGITSQMELPVAELDAYHIRSSLLALDDTGRVGVRLVDDNNIVQFYRVNIIGNDASGVWLTGVPESGLLITVGQEYVSRGEKVEYILNQATAALAKQDASL